MLPVKLTLKPMEAQSVEAIPHGDGWQYEPKWDGFRCIALAAARRADQVAGAQRSRPGGNRFAPSWSSKLSMTSSRAIASDTARSFCAGALTRNLAFAPLLR